MPGRCYAVMFSNGHVKFGRTKLLGRRISSHRTAASAHSVHVDGVFFTSAIEDEAAAEKAIIRAASKVMDHANGETFIFASKDAVEIAMRKSGADVMFATDIFWSNGKSVVHIDDSLPAASSTVFDFDIGVLEERILKAVHGTKLSFAVICNRMRNQPRKHVEAALKKLEAENFIFATESKHAGTGQITKKYSARK